MQEPGFEQRTGRPVRAVPDKAPPDRVVVAAPAFSSCCVDSLRYRRPVTVHFSNITRPWLKILTRTPAASLRTGYTNRPRQRFPAPRALSRTGERSDHCDRVLGPVFPRPGLWPLY